MIHLSAAHASTKLVAKNTVFDTVDLWQQANLWAPLTKTDTEASKQLKLDVSAPASQKTCDTDWTECNDRQVCCWKF